MRYGDTTHGRALGTKSAELKKNRQKKARKIIADTGKSADHHVAGAFLDALRLKNMDMLPYKNKRGRRDKIAGIATTKPPLFIFRYGRLGEIFCLCVAMAAKKELCAEKTEQKSSKANIRDYFIVSGRGIIVYV